MIGSPLFETYLRFMLEGALVTVELSAASIAIGVAIGLVGGAGRASSIRWLRAFVGVYVEVLRSIPVLIQLFLVFYGVPALTGMRLDPFAAAVATLSIYLGAYMTEAVRAGIEAVPMGQVDAAHALGFGYLRMMRLVVLPQALRVIIPAGIGLSIAALKDSALASIIGLTELTRAGLAVRENTLSNWDVLAFMTLIYFVLCSALSYAGYWVENRLRVSDRNLGLDRLAAGAAADLVRERVTGA